jgi:hypothetical protein
MYALLRQPGAHFDQRDIALVGDSVENEIGVSLDLVRKPAAALRPGARIALFGIKGVIANRTRRTDAKSLGRLAVGHAASDGSYNAFTKIEGWRFYHARQHTSSARILNQSQEIRESHSILSGRNRSGPHLSGLGVDRVRACPQVREVTQHKLRLPPFVT